ncbi:MAG: LytR/AlgR family response regulator transcription factor [Lachnospiraceae bacterium]|jgi:DNA-binding LytR/AlgR family response regulator
MKEKVQIIKGNERYIVNLQDISYFETCAGKLLAHVVNGSGPDGEREIEFPGTMKQLEERLRGKGFCRIHRCYLVSLDYIGEVSQGTLRINAGKESLLPIGRVYAEQLMGSIEKYHAVLI